MNIQSAKEQIKDTVEAYLETDEAGLYVIPTVHQRPVFLLGAPGIGKTAIMEQIAQELGIGMVSYSMTHHTRQSALGLPRIEHHDFEGYEYESSEYTMSEIIGAIYDYMERTDLRCGILFLDEINCVSETLYPSMLQFLQFKTFGKHKVPDGWIVVCAGNPPEYNKQVHEFDIVTLDRLREIDVDPDYAAFKSYAMEKGLHPAVTTFLETKKDCYYKVESKPGGGKSFVTTRGWEDLADVISLYERMGKPVNRDLIVQFLRDDDIADQFAVYYSLFEKYKSDYQVQSILSGDAVGTIKTRAQSADFDERIALIGLLLDALVGDCGDVVRAEAVVLELRDVLRSIKDAMIQGGAVDVVLKPVIDKREAALARRADSGVMSQSAIRKERLVIAKLREFASRCVLERTPEGDAAFHTIERAYKDEVAALKPLTEKAGMHMTNAFAFVDECFGDREMLIFVADLATNKTTTRYLARYGNDAYYAHNDQLQVDSSRMGLEERAAMLAELDENIKDAKGPADNSMLDFMSVDMSGASAISGGGVSSGAKGGAASAPGTAASDSQANEASASNATASGSPSDTASGPGTAAGSLSDEAAREIARKPITPTILEDYYKGKEFEYGYATVCEMRLPASELKGKKVLDIGCRRGRGVYKISSMVGESGLAMGTDWVRAYVDEACDGIDRAWHDSGLHGNNMDIRFAYPEDLIAAGIGSSTLDYVYLNNVINLFYDQGAALAEISRVLKPGGTLILETIYASEERPEDFIEAAKEIGNSIQASFTEEQVLGLLESVGMSVTNVIDEYALERDRGYKEGEHVETVPGDEGVSYKSISLNVVKER